MMYLIRCLIAVAIVFVPTLSSYGSALVTATKLSASTNSFAPLDQSMYFDQQIIENQSPASVSASGDWRGTNFGGGAETWHWTGHSQTDQEVTSSATGFAVSGSASFNWTMTTAPEFVSPLNQAVLYGPGGGAGFRTWFSLTETSSYTLSATLSRYASLSIYSVSNNAAIYSINNPSNTPINLNESGILPPGAYSVGGGVGAGGVTNMGASNWTRTGTLSNFLFTLQVPEPAGGMAMALAGGMLLHRRRRQTVQ